jgi:hypothetical protein
MDGSMMSWTRVSRQHDVIGLNPIDPGRHVKSYASAKLEFRHDLIGLELC